MEEDDRKRLQANYKDILRDVRAKDIKDYLLQEGVLTDEDVEEVSLSTITPTDRMRRLLQILPRRGPDAFRHFIGALKEEYEFLVKQILETDISKVVLADSDETDNKEKLNILQQQLWEQTKYIVKCQEEISTLQSQVQEQENLKAKYDEIEQVLKRNGWMSKEFAVMLRAGVSVEETDSGAHSMKERRCSVSRLDEEFIKEKAIELGLDIMEYMAHPAKPARDQITINMRRVVSDILSQYKQMFQEIVQRLNMTEMNGYETLLRIAEEIFRGQNNWGRIGVWYTFGAYVARHCQANGMPDMGEWIGKFTGVYVGENLLQWIQKNDGWNGFNKFVADKERNKDKESSSGTLGITLGAIGLAGLMGLGAYAALKS